jgi:hypothetical protein
MTSICFENPWGDVPPDFSSAQRRHVLQTAARALKEVKAAAAAHTDVSGGGVYVGLGGVALTYLRIAQQVGGMNEATSRQRRFKAKSNSRQPIIGAPAPPHPSTRSLPAAPRHHQRAGPQGLRGHAYPHGKYLKKHTAPYALELADRFATDAEALLTVGKRVTFLEGYSGSLALQAVVRALLGDQDGSRAKLRVGVFGCR